MSAFTETAPTTEQEVAKQTTTETTESYVKKLVDAKGDQWQDPETIAKGKIEADAYIVELKAELATAQARSSKEDRLAELISKFENKAADVTPATTQTKANSDADDLNTTGGVSEKDIKSLVEETLTKRDLDASVQQNVKRTDEGLIELFGSEQEAQEKVKEKAGQLGLTVKRLESIASESPTAFFALIGEKAPLKLNTSATIRTESASFNPSGTKNNSYFQSIRKEDPRKFNSAVVQDQMIQQRIKLGDKFYK